MEGKVLTVSTPTIASVHRSGQVLIKSTDHKKTDLPIEHSSISWLQAPPTKPAGQVQMARPLRGLVSHTAPSLQGLLTHASSRWHSKPVEKVQKHILPESPLLFLIGLPQKVKQTAFNRLGYIYETWHAEEIWVLNAHCSGTVLYSGLSGIQKLSHESMYLSFQLDTRRRRMPHGHGRWLHWNKRLWHSHQCSHCSHLPSNHWHKHKCDHRLCRSKYLHCGKRLAAWDTRWHPQRSIALEWLSYTLAHVYSQYKYVCLKCDLSGTVPVHSGGHWQL